MKHSKFGKLKVKKIIIMSILIFILISLIFYSISSSKAGTEKDIVVNNHIINDENIIEENQNEVPVQPQPNEQFEMVDISDFPSEIGGYNVIGKIVIDKIGVENYILDRTTNESLNLAVTWFWGPNENNREVNIPRQYIYYWS